MWQSLRGGRERADPPGRAVQVDPIKPALKVPGNNRLKLRYDEPLSNVAFEFNLRRYTLDAAMERGHIRDEELFMMLSDLGGADVAGR
jgi:hypothetical protein